MNIEAEKILKKFVESQIDFMKTIEEQTQQINGIAQKNNETLKLTNNMMEAFTGKFTPNGGKTK